MPRGGVLNVDRSAVLEQLNEPTGMIEAEEALLAYSPAAANVKTMVSRQRRIRFIDALRRATVPQFGLDGWRSGSIVPSRRSTLNSTSSRSADTDPSGGAREYAAARRSSVVGCRARAFKGFSPARCRLGDRDAATSDETVTDRHRRLVTPDADLGLPFDHRWLVLRAGA